MNKKSLTALVLSGGGARGAYEAGIMHYIRSVMTKKYNLKKHFDIYCGSSVGAINTCYLASTAEYDPIDRGNTLYNTWSQLKQDEIYLRDTSALRSFLYKATKGITFNLFKNPKKQKAGDYFSGFFDTTPLPNFIKKHIDFKLLNQSVDKGPVTAIALTASNLTTDELVLFLKKKADHPYIGPYKTIETDLNIDHPIASGAIPIIFPPRKIGNYYYMDGGIKLNTPLSPAIQLGAKKILIIGLHNEQERVSRRTIEQGLIYPPTLGEIIGKVLNSIFLDKITYDVEQLERINRIITWTKELYGPNYLKDLNHMLQISGEEVEVAKRGLKELKVLSLFPSRDIREIFHISLTNPGTYQKHFGRLEKFLLKILDVDLIQGQDFLSYLMFLPDYLTMLLELGIEDAKAKEDEIVEFLTCED